MTGPKQTTHLNRDDAVEALPFKLILGGVSGNHLQVVESLLPGLAVDVLLLRLRVGKCHNVGVGEDLSEVQRSRAPAASAVWTSVSSDDLLADLPSVQ